APRSDPTHVPSGVEGGSDPAERTPAAGPTPLYRRLLVYLRPYVWPHFVIAVVCMLLFSATSGAMPFLIRHIFDDVFTARDVLALKVLPGIIVGVFLLRGLVGFGSTYLTEYVGQRIVA